MFLFVLCLRFSPRFFTTPINKYGDNPVLVAARSGNVDLLRLFWDDNYPVYTQNKKGETVYMCGANHPEIMKFIEQKVSRTVLDEFIYTKAFSTAVSSDSDLLPALRAKYGEQTRCAHKIKKLMNFRKQEKVEIHAPLC